MSDDMPRFDPERDPEWRERLTDLQYHVTREAGTEPPNSGIHYMEDRRGSIFAFAVDIYCLHLK